MPPVQTEPLTTPTEPAIKPAAGTSAPLVQDGAAPPEKPVRPEWLGKSFDGYWSDDKGFDGAKFDTEFTALNTLKAEAEKRAAGVPEKPEDYEVALPADFALPEGVDPKSVTFNADDPIIKELLPDIRATAKALGLDKDGFKQLVGLKMRLDLAETAMMRKAAVEQKTLLGTKAEARVTALTTFLTSKLGAEHANVLLPMMFTAKQIEAFEKLQLLASGSGAKPNGGGRETHQPEGMTESQWDALSPTQKIAKGRELDAQRKAN